MNTENKIKALQAEGQMHREERIRLEKENERLRSLIQILEDHQEKLKQHEANR